MGDMVIVAYRPKAGAAEALLELTRDHAPFLRRLGLATDRPALAMHNRDGVIVEVFEWKQGAAASTHEHPEVLALGERYAVVCKHVPLHELPETRELFAAFRPIDL